MGYSPNFRGDSSKAPARGIASTYQSGSLSDINGFTPVSINGAGQISPTDVTSQVSVEAFVGLTNALVPSSANGVVVSSGRVEEFPSSSFNIGDPVYIGKNGILIKTRPDYGVAGFTTGDFVIFLGVVVKNEFDISKKDILLSPEVIGQL